MARKSAQRMHIKEIYVENLFGYYTYTIPNNGLVDLRKRLLIIYGDNGSGKTTILKLVFNLLSAVNKAGHKSNIANIIFSQIKVTLESGIQIIALRDEAKEGSFDYIIKENGDEKYNLHLQANEKNVIRLEDESAENVYFLGILDFIKKLNISILFLPDNRKILSNVVDEYESLISKNVPESLGWQEYAKIRQKRIYGEDSDELILTVKNLENWIRQHVIQGSRKGEKNTSVIYDDIVNRITKSRKRIAKLDQKALMLRQQLEDIRKRSIEYVKYGLISKVDTKQLENILGRTKEDKLQIIYNVIEPYAEGIRARLDSLEDIQDLIYSFTESINSYFTNKQINYHLSTGFVIRHTHSKDSLKLTNLSSGERQLLLLLCNVITASDNANIFIIDEPELSLNVKWQRKLGDTLLDFGKGRNVQFILATHSIELLTNHQQHVCKLVNQNKL